jgi:hypothetical protein
VAAGFAPLCNNDIGAARLQPARLGDRRCRRHHAAPGRFDASQQGRLRQPEMETHDLGLDLFHHCTKGVVERENLRLTCRERGIEAEFVVIGGEPIAPIGFASTIGPRRAVAEKVRVDRPAGQPPQLVDRLYDDFGPLPDATEGAQAAAGADRGREFDRSDTCHRRQHQRVFDAEKVDKATVRPHRFFSTPLTSGRTDGMAAAGGGRLWDSFADRLGHE